MTTSPSVIEVTGLRMDYGTTRVLRGVDLSVAPGEVVALLGPNGAGKTTTVEILEGFRAPSAGRVRVLGEEPLHAGDAWRARIGVVLQSWRDHARWRVGDLLAHLGEFYRGYATPERPRPWDHADLLDRVGLGAKHDRRLLDLSGGERRRLDVAIGLVGRPEVLFLDEPTAGFDPQARRDFHDLLRDVADAETTILMTTHDLDEAEQVADRILILTGGRIVADGSPDVLRRKASRIAEIRWSEGGQTHVHGTDDPVPFVRELLVTGRTVADLEVRRPRLEDAYFALVREHGDAPDTHPAVLAPVAEGVLR